MYREHKWKYEPVLNLSKTEILRHFGYDPQIYSGIQCGLWNSEQVYEEIPGLKEFQKIHGKKKVRVILDYDPDYPKAMFRIEQIPEAEENSIPLERLRKVLAESYGSYRRSLEHSLRGLSSET